MKEERSEREREREREEGRGRGGRRDEEALPVAADHRQS